MTRRSEKDYIKAAVNLSVVVASTSAANGEACIALLLWILLKPLVPTFQSM
jgi:hypothetical protein